MLCIHPYLCPHTDCRIHNVMCQDAHRSLGFGPRSWRRLKHESRNPSVGVEDDIEDDSNKVFVSSSERCKQLYLEAMDRGVKINGKICSAVMLGFGCDLAVRCRPSVMTP